MPSVLLRQGTWLTRQDPRPQEESTVHWVPVRTGGAILHWPNACEFHNSVPALLSPLRLREIVCLMPATVNAIYLNKTTIRIGSVSAHRRKELSRAPKRVGVSTVDKNSQMHFDLLESVQDLSSSSKF